MAGFLRRKTKILRHDPEPAAETVNTSASSPIFARFATTFTSSGQQPRNAASPSLHGRVVSQPMALGSASPQRAVRTSHVLGESQQPPQRHNAQELPRTATHVHRKNDHPTRALSTSGSTVAQGKPERAVRPVPAFYDKPLPIPIPTDDDPSAANTLTRPQDDPTPVFQRAAVLRPLSPSHDTRPLQSAAFPPSAYETGPQLTQRRSTSVDVPQQIRRNTNVDQQVPAGMSPPDSGVPHQLRHKHDVQSLPPLPPMYARQNSNHIVNPPPQAGSTQVYNRQAYDGTPPRTSATRNESTVSSYTLRKDALMLEPKPGMRGGAIPSGGQSNSRLGGSSVYIDANGLGSTVATNGIGIRYDTKALPSRPISQGEVSNIYVDASEEPKQATPVLGAGELSPESVPNRVSFFPPCPSFFCFSFHVLLADEFLD
ncbi:hypothetical protein AX15_007119 [Amanita polypyramis BW_CC]|nr:hypothetical protein AX15_007119 [Amanita polypyramis BW_CC]